MVINVFSVFRKSWNGNNLFILLNSSDNRTRARMGNDYIRLALELCKFVTVKKFLVLVMFRKIIAVADLCKHLFGYNISFNQVVYSFQQSVKLKLLRTQSNKNHQLTTLLINAAQINRIRIYFKH